MTDKEIIKVETDALLLVESVVKIAYEKASNGDWSALQEISVFKKMGYFWLYQAISEAILQNVWQTGEAEKKVDESADELVDEQVQKAKQKPKGNGGIVFSTRVDEEVVKKLKGYAFYNGITLKQALETIITNYLEGKTIARTKEE